MISFSLFGIPIRILPWFWITMAIIGTFVIGDGNSFQILKILIFMLAGLFSILVHELGHALTIRKFGLPTAITLQAFGGFASYPAGILTRKQSFLVTAAGPALQFILGILAFIIFVSVPVPPQSLLSDLLRYLVNVSIAWSILNCIPVYPMDGGQMMAAVLGPKRAHFVHLISAVVAVAIGGSVYLYQRDPILPIFMAMFAWQNWKAFQASTSKP